MTEREPISGSSRDYGTASGVPAVGFADFSPTELYNLSESIASNVTFINTGLRSLERMMRQIGGSNDNVTLRDKIHNSQQSVNSCVAVTARDIQRLGVVVRRGDKPQKLQVERLTQTFKDSLAKYASVQKQLSEKMQAHVPKASKQRLDTQLMEQQAIAEDEEATLIANQQAQARLIQFETSMLQEKEAYISEIEANVLDVNQIMQDLAKIVTSQGQTVDSVENHIEAATSNVESGVAEIAKGAEYQRSYRKKMFILIIIGIIVGILLVTFIVRSFR